MIPADSGFPVDWAEKELFGADAKVYSHRADSAFQVDWAKKNLFGTHAKVYGFRLRRSSDVRTSVCVRRCDSVNFIVEN